MLKISTRNKILGAKILNRAVALGRGLTGQKMTGCFKRNGLTWSLDLNEGIDFAIWLQGQFEPDLFSCYKKLIRPGDTVLDIGANIGAHTLPIAKCVGPNGRVIAIEATEYAIKKLKGNLNLNPELSSRVSVQHTLLVSHLEAPREESIASSWPLTGTESVDSALGGALRTVGDASSRTLDQVLESFNWPKIALIKMDVDGHELDVLSGAKKLLSQQKPVILMELAPYCFADKPGAFKNLTETLTSIGYQFHELNSNRLLPSKVSELIDKIPRVGSINVRATCV